MNALQAAAVEAVEKAHADGDLAGSLKIKALKFLRDATGLSLPQCVPAIEYAMARRRVLARMTRAEKERAVRLMTDRVVEAADQYAHTNLEGTIEECLGWLHTRERRRKALLRLAMARTAD